MTLRRCSFFTVQREAARSKYFSRSGGGTASICFSV
jgi:hypothetical protein